MASSKDDTENKRRSPIPKGFTQTSLPKTIVEDLQGAGRVVFTSSTRTQLSWIRRDGEMSISNQVNNGVGIVGDRNKIKQNTRDVTIHIDNSGDGNIDFGGVFSS
jgi:hypothetical protein